MAESGLSAFDPASDPPEGDPLEGQRFGAEGPDITRRRGVRTAAEKRRRLGGWLIGLVALAGLGLTLSARFLGDPPQVLNFEVSGRLAVLPFATDGARGDAWLPWGLAALTAEGLAANDAIQVVTLDRLYSVLAERDLASTQTDRARQQQLARALGAETVLDVTLERIGERVVLHAAFFGEGDRLIGRQDLEAGAPLEGVSRLISAVADRMLRGGAAVSLDEVLSNDDFVRQLYGEGVDRLLAQGAAEGRPYFEIALRHRPEFSLARLRLAESLRAAGEIDAARDLAQALLQQTQARGQRVLQARAYRSLGLISAVAGDVAVAAEHYRQAQRLEEQRRAPLGRAESLAGEAQLAIAEGKPERAQELFVEVLQIRQGAGDRFGQIDTLVRLSSLSIGSGQLDAAQAVLEDARSMAQDLRDVWEERRVAASLGEVAWRRGDAAMAVENWQQALSFYHQRQDTSRELLLTRNLARAQAALGHLDEAEEMSHQQLDLAEREKRPGQEADASLRLALLQLRQGYPSQARIHLDRALELDRFLEDRSELQRAIAWTAYEQGNYDLAVSTQRQLKSREDGQMSPYDAAFLAVFEKARAEKRRLPLPFEAEYSPPEEAAKPGGPG